MTRMVMSERMPWEPASYDSSQDMFLGAAEIEAIDKLPPPLVAYLLEEAEDPAFVSDYLVQALRTQDPYETIMSDMAREAAEYQLGSLSADVETGLGRKKKGGVFKRIGKFFKRVEKKTVRQVERTWRKYGTIILMVVGAVFSIFGVGVVLMAAAAAMSAANQMYRAQANAKAAKRAARKDAGQLQAEADAKTAEVAAQVEEFYRKNPQWFLDHAITPDKWAKLTLDEKIDIINAGVKGSLPVGIGPVVGTDTGPAPGGGVTPPTGVPSGGAPSGGQPVYIPGGGGGGPRPGGAAPGGGEPSYGPPPGGEAPPEAAGATVGTFDLVIEGNPVGTFATLEGAARAAIGMTKLGDRFEVIANGKSTGLRVRTSDGSIDVPPDMEQSVRMMSREKMVEFVADAEKETKKGGFPWWILLVAGGAAKVAGVI